jgi:hypothetical protein
MEKRKPLGILLILTGLFFLGNPFPAMTGFAISETSSGSFSAFVGLVLILGGVGLLMSGLERKIEIYRDENKKGDDSYYLIDFYGLFTNPGGKIDFLSFLKQAEQIRDDTELLNDAKKEYSGPLIAIADEGGIYSDIAKRCLKVMSIDYVEDSVKDSLLTHDEITEIKSAFNIWDGKITSQQKEVLSRYRIKYQEKGRKTHPKLVSPYNDSIPMPSTPSDRARGNKNLISDIKRLCESFPSRYS